MSVVERDSEVRPSDTVARATGRRARGYSIERTREHQPALAEVDAREHLILSSKVVVELGHVGVIVARPLVGVAEVLDPWRACARSGDVRLRPVSENISSDRILERYRDDLVGQWIAGRHAIHHPAGKR